MFAFFLCVCQCVRLCVFEFFSVCLGGCMSVCVGWLLVFVCVFFLFCNVFFVLLLFVCLCICMYVYTCACVYLSHYSPHRIGKKSSRLERAAALKLAQEMHGLLLRPSYAGVVRCLERWVGCN